AMVLATGPAAFVFGVLGMPQLYVVAFLTGTLSVFFIVAYQAYLPTLVGRPHLVEANGKMNATASLAQLAGPSVAGVLVQLFTAPMPVVVDAVSFVASLVGVSLITRPEPALVPRRRDMVGEIREGLTALLGHRVLRAVVIGAALTVLLFSAQLDRVRAARRPLRCIAVQRERSEPPPGAHPATAPGPGQRELPIPRVGHRADRRAPRGHARRAVRTPRGAPHDGRRLHRDLP